MKNKLVKVTWLFIMTLGILAFIYLAFFPLKHEVQFAYYDSNAKIITKKLSSEVNTIIKVTKPDIFRLIVFLESEDHDNINVSLTSLNGEKVFDEFVEHYKPSIMFFEFLPLKVGEEYKLTIKDLDGDILELPVLKSNDNSYLENDHQNTIRLGAAYRENYYFYLWYPLFLFVFAFTIYPFIWRGDKYEK